MKPQLRTARKEHECAYCGQPIKKGEKYNYETGREPRYSDDFKQVGITYWTARLHTYDCWEKIPETGYNSDCPY